MDKPAVNLRGLYAVADTDFLNTRLLDAVATVLNAGVSIVQYRDKCNDPQRRLDQAQSLQSLCKTEEAVLIINDDVELAAAVGAAGVHLGRNDASCRQARSRLGKRAIIGVSCYNDLMLAQQAVADGADYIAFGSVYPSPTKPAAVRAPLQLFTRAASLNIPVCAIGGITLHNAPALVEAGVDMLAVISGLFGSGNIGATAKAFNSLFASRSINLSNVNIDT